MNRFLLISFLFLFTQAVSFALPLTGTKNIPGDYATLALAINDLNAQGVGTGGVILNLLPGNNQTAPAGGYVIGGAGSAVLTTAASSSQITIQGNGNIITAYTPQASGSLVDAIFKIIGGDYITIQGFTLQENPANTFTSAADNTMTEFGIAVFYVTQTDGAKFNTIQNNTISLNRLYANSFGIYSSVRHSSTSLTTADITNVSGSSEGLHIFGNTISNVNECIAVIGSSTAAYMNTGIDIGGSTGSTGNIISNYGKSNPLSTYPNVSSTSFYGILVYSAMTSNVSYNTITCPGLNTASAAYGIGWSGNFAPPSGVLLNSITHNSVSVKNGNLAGAVYGIRYDPYTVTQSYDISYNDFHDFGYSGGNGNASVYCILSGAQATNGTFSFNTFTNLNVNTSGDCYLIRESANVATTSSTKTVSNNSIVTGFTKSVSGGTVYCYNGSNDNSGVGNVIVTNNTFSNIILTGNTGFYGYTVNSQAPSKTVFGNTITNVTGGTGQLTGFSSSAGAYTEIYNNTISNFSGAGAITGMSCGAANTVVQNIYSNSIYGLASSGAANVYGIQSSATGTESSSSIFKNSVFNLTGTDAASIVYGIYASAGTTVSVYNNMISDLRTPSANSDLPLAGIYVNLITSARVFYNSVLLTGTSSGSLFGSAALFASTVPVLDLRNNIFTNLCIPQGTGVTSAYRRSSTSMATYSANSNANAFYAGLTEDATHAIFFDGTTAYGIADFKTHATPSDAVSFRENPPFINSAAAPFNLHVQTTVSTLCEGGAISISSPFLINDDIDSDTRTATPDVGADEFSGTAGGVVNPGNLTATVISSQQIDVSFTPNPNFNNVVIVWNSTGIFTTPAGTPPTPGQSFAGGTLLYYGTTSPYHHTGLTFGNTYYYKAFSYDALSASYSAGLTANAFPYVAPPTGLILTAISDTEIDLAYSLNAPSDDVLIVSNGTASFGTPINGTGYSAGNTLPGGGIVIYKGPLAAFSHTGLSPVSTYYYAIWSVDEFNYYSSSNLTGNATTYCTALNTLPWFEGFENMTSTGNNLLPDCWRHQNLSGNNYTCSETCNENTAHAGTNFLGGTGIFDVWNFTPGVSLTGGVSYTFSYWFKCTSTVPAYNITVAYGTLPSIASMNKQISSETGLNITSWTNRQIQFTPEASGVYYIGFHDLSTTSLASGIAFDDFSLDITYSCNAPTNLTITGVTTTGATMSWTSTATAWEYQVIPSGGTPAASGIPATGNPVTLSGLSPNTSYDVYVRSNCSGLYSSWAGPVSFTTLCSIFTSPFTQAFTDPLRPSCWSISGPQEWSFRHTTHLPEWGAATVHDHSAGNMGNFAWVDGSSGAGLTGITMLSPEINVSSLLNPRIRFFLFNNNVNTINTADELQLKVDVWDGAVWQNAAFTWAYGQNAADWQEKTINLSAYTISGPIRIRFVVDKGSGSTTYDDLLIDDVTVEETPDCLYPSSLSAIPGNTFANLSWTPGGTETSWDIEWGELGFMKGTGTVINAATNPLFLSGLSPITAYSYYVRANCGSSQSIWIGPLNFVTLVSCPSPTSLAVSGIQDTKANLSWSEPGTATIWNVQYGPEGFTPGTGTIITGIAENPYQLTALNSGTRYDYFVQSDCGGGMTSSWSGPYTFTTLCSTIISYPWTQGFESMAYLGNKVLPPCMSYENVVGSNGPVSSDLNSLWYGPHTGNKFIYTSVYNTTWIFTPAMNLIAGTSYDFSFWMMNKVLTAPNDFSMDVAYGFSNSSEGMTHSLASGVNCINSSYVQFNYSFTPTASGTYYLGIKTTSNNTTAHAVSFDDFRFEPTPACSLPTNLTVSNVTSTSANIGWSGATTVQFEYDVTGHTAGTGTITGSASANPYTLSGLNPATTYDIYVRKDCGSGSFSPWFGPVGFTTQCSAAMAPFTENFESAVFTPSCWSNNSVSGTSSYSRSTSASGYGNGLACAFANFYNQSAGQIYDLLTLPFNITSLPGATLKFDYAYANFNGEVDQLDLYYSTDSGISYSLLLSMPGGATGILNTAGTQSSWFTPTASQWATQRITLPAGTNIVRFRATSAFGNNLYLDNISVDSQIAHDASATSIGLNDVVQTGTVIPKALVRNEGANTETFTATMTIGSYSSTKTITSLPANTTFNVTFDPWTAVAGDYTANLSILLAGDTDPANNSMTKSLKVMDLNKTVFAYMTTNMASPDPEGPTTFNLANPLSVNSLANQSVQESIIGGTWGNGVWYGTTVDAPYYRLLSLDPATGIRTFISYLPAPMMGLSYNPLNNTLYGVAWNGQNSLLFAINPLNGITTLVGNCGNRVLINIAINNAGQAYSVDITNDVLCSVSLTTGFATAIGSLGFDASFYQGMEFDRDSGNLFLAANGVAVSWLALVNTTTGEALKIGDIEGNAELTALAIPYQSNKTLTINLFLEGLFNGSGTMRKAQDENGNHFPGTTADQINVELHNSSNYSNIVYTATNINLSTSGTASITVPSSYSGAYWLTIRHRNSIATVSSTPVSFSGSGISYSFDNLTKAYGSNLHQVGSFFLIYGGDENQDGLVDSSDMIDVDNAVASFASGYLFTDVNGDGLVDSSDMILIDNNSASFVGSITP